MGRENILQLYRLASLARGKTFLNVSSTREGGGVAEMLHRINPLLEELGIRARWEVIEGDEEFFEITKSFHNALQGRKAKLTSRMFDHYLEVNRANARRLDLDADFVLIHDPQPAALIHFRRHRHMKWVWRCHIDISHPDREVWKFLRGFVAHHDASIFSIPQFSQQLPHPQYIVYPSIDPLSDKNRDLSPAQVRALLNKMGVQTDKPLILQVSRFDRFKDPLGVIDAFEMVRAENSSRLALVGGGATDDPEGEAVLEEVNARASGDPDIYVLPLPPDSNLEINALQRAAAVVLQKSTKEGFGLTITEAMWKRKPVIGGAVGGIVHQIFDYHTGFLVHSVEGAAYRIRYLFNRPEMARRMGRTGREFVLHNFLLPRHIRDYIAIMIMLLRLH